MRIKNWQSLKGLKDRLVYKNKQEIAKVVSSNDTPKKRFYSQI